VIIMGALLRVAVTTIVVCALAVSVYAGCTGSPPTYNGLPCATTTRYWDGLEGACGCGNSAGSFSWDGAQYTAAASQLLFDPSSASWCGSGCGTCWQLTPTGDCPTGGTCASNTNPITIMITNLCPYNGNAQWCPNPNNANQYGYHQHFDLMDPNMSGWVDSIGWNNPVVTYKQVACGTGGSPTCSEYSQCVCSSSGACVSTTPTPAPTPSPTTTHAPAPTPTTTHAPAPTPTTTHAPAPTPTTTHAPAPTPSSSGTCTATVSTTLTLYGGGGGGQVAITVKNTGSKSITAVTLTITGSPSVYNLVTGTSGTYNLASYAYPLAAGASFTGAGFTYSGSTEPTVTIGTTTC